MVVDKNAGTKRLSSAPFKDPMMSVDLECLLIVDGWDWQYTLARKPGHYLIKFEAGVARLHEQVVVHRPLEGNKYHGQVEGKKKAAVIKALQAAFVWVKRPPDVG